LTPEWKIVSVAVGKTINIKTLPDGSDPICSKCRKFVLSSSMMIDAIQFAKWWRDLTQDVNPDQNPAKSSSVKLNCYKKFVGRTLGFSLRKKNDFFATLDQCR